MPSTPKSSVEVSEDIQGAGRLKGLRIANVLRDETTFVSFACRSQQPQDRTNLSHEADVSLDLKSPSIFSRSPSLRSRTSDTESRRSFESSSSEFKYSPSIESENYAGKDGTPPIYAPITNVKYTRAIGLSPGSQRLDPAISSSCEGPQHFAQPRTQKERHKLPASPAIHSTENGMPDDCSRLSPLDHRPYDLTLAVEGFTAISRGLKN